MNPIFMKSENVIAECLVITTALSCLGLGGTEIALYVSSWHTQSGKQEEVIYFETEWDSIL